MRLVMIRDLSGVEKRFLIYDESGNLIYRVTGSYDDVGSTLILWDEEGKKSVTAVQRNPVKYVYSVQLEGIPVLKIFRRIRYIYPCCKIFDVGWRIKGNLQIQEYEVAGTHGEIVFSQKKIWTSRGEGFELRIYAPHYQKICLGIAMVLNDTIPADCFQIFVRS